MVAVGTDLAAYRSVHTAALNALAVKPDLDLWSGAYKSVTNIALEHSEARAVTSQGSDVSALRLEYALDGTLDGDLLTGCWLQVNLPPLTATATHLPLYAWGCGWGMIERAEFLIGSEASRQEVIFGEYCDMAQELHSSPGQTFESVFKFDSITVPELSRLSQQPQTLFVPLRFFFCKGAACVIPHIKMKSKAAEKPMRVHIQLRNLEDFVINLPHGISDVGGATTADLQSTVTNTMPQSGGRDLTYAQFGQFRLWVSQVYLDTAEQDTFRNMTTYQGLATTAQALTEKGRTFEADGTRKEHTLPFRHPIKNLMWAIRDRKSGQHGLVYEHSNAVTLANLRSAPFSEDSVRSLFGSKASHEVVVVDQADEEATTSGTGVDVYSDWNKHRIGSQGIYTLDNGTDASSSQIRTSRDVEDYKLNGKGPYLPLNRFDYRAVSSNGVEVEPLKRISLKLANQDRFQQDLQDLPEYFRLVQTHYFQRQARKGIYAYSFALNSSSQLLSGSANFTKLYNKDLQVTCNNAVPNQAALLMFAESLNIFECGDDKSGDFVSALKFVS